MLALVESESCFGAYVCHRRPAGLPATSDLVHVIVVTMRGWSDVDLWVAVCFLAKISVHIYNLVCTIDTVTGNLAVNSVFITFRSMRETKKFHIFFFIFQNSFLYKITVSFTMVIKRSPGGESAGDGRSTSKSTCTCADPAWSLTAFGDRPASGMSKLSASVNSDLRNGSFWLEIPHAEHVDRCSWNMRE